MSLRAAEIIAGRLGVGVADLMRPPTDSARESQFELLLLRAEGELRAGRHDVVLQQLQAISGRLSGSLAARATRLRGLALLGAGRPRDAARALDDARRGFAAVNERELAIRTTFDLAMSYGRTDEHGESLALTLDTARALEAGELVDRTLELRVYAYLASKFVTIGDASSADRYAERAKSLAEDVVDPASVAHLHLSLAITRQEQGDIDAALQHARRALAAYEQLGDRRQIASAWNTIGWVYTRRNQYTRAADAFAAAEKAAAELHDERLLGYVLQSRGELELAQGNADEAVRLAEASAAVSGISTRCRGLSELLRAQGLAQRKEPLPSVRRAFESAFRTLELEGRPLLARAHQAYFEVLKERGEFREATAEAERTLELVRPELS
jgi:tetratricopeptide (TPR) repeat protein